jgi:translation initiation factor IF-2
MLSHTISGIIIGFNVKASRQILSTAQQLQIPILQNNVIYRLIDEVKERVIALLPKLYDQRVVGEATIQQVFKYSVKGSVNKTIAGCRVTNGQLNKKSKVRIIRNGETIFDGNMASLKHHKEEVDEMRKGSDCGIMLDGYEGFQEEDTLQCYEETERKRAL